MNDQIPELKIERIEEKFGAGLIFLERGTGGKFDRVPSGDGQAQGGHLSVMEAMLVGLSKHGRHAERTSQWVSNSQSLLRLWDCEQSLTIACAGIEVLHRSHGFKEREGS